jgi:hypothetical protein
MRFLPAAYLQKSFTLMLSMGAAFSNSVARPAHSRKMMKSPIWNSLVVYTPGHLSTRKNMLPIDGTIVLFVCTYYASPRPIARAEFVWLLS